MLLGENILLALSGLLANKMRALLTMLGIIIGISSVIAIMSVEIPSAAPSPAPWRIWASTTSPWVSPGKHGRYGDL